MKTAFIIHGTSDTPDSHWFGWLKRELEKREYEIVAPQFPWIQEESYEKWAQLFEEHEYKMNTDSIFIGHSLGTCFILKLLSEKDIKVHGIYLIGAWGEIFSEEILLNQHKKFKEVGFDIPFDWMKNYESFVEKLDFEKIKNSAQKRFIINSKNDPYIPLELAENLQKNIDAELILYSHAGHFCKRDGYTEFWDLLDVIQR